jgi:hypothetical protein
VPLLRTKQNDVSSEPARAAAADTPLWKPQGQVFSSACPDPEFPPGSSLQIDGLRSLRGRRSGPHRAGADEEGERSWPAVDPPLR